MSEERSFTWNKRCCSERTVPLCCWYSMRSQKSLCEVIFDPNIDQYILEVSEFTRKTKKTSFLTSVSLTSLQRRCVGKVFLQILIAMSHWGSASRSSLEMRNEELWISTDASLKNVSSLLVKLIAVKILWPVTDRVKGTFWGHLKAGVHSIGAIVDETSLQSVCVTPLHSYLSLWVV